MNATDRIKEQQEIQEGDHHFASITLDSDCGQCGYNGKFLLRAFKVMREVAISEHQCWCKDKRCDAGPSLDGEFNERMGEAE